MPRARKRALLGACALSLLAITGFGCSSTSNDAARSPTSPSFNGLSTELQNTAILPTLDTPLPEGKSAIWCASFQVAWRQLQDKVTHGPVRLDGAADVADRLNAAPSVTGDLTPGSYCAVGGLVSEGAADEVRREMAKLFPDVPVPDYAQEGYAAIAYAYLRASLRFPLPYYREQLDFTDARGERTKVRAFGFAPDRQKVPSKLKGQPAILFSEVGGANAFAVDLCRDSDPNQVIVARLDRKKTLAEACDAVHTWTEAEQKKWPDSAMRRPGALLVPMMDWSVGHHFAELEGKKLQNAGLTDLSIDRVFQAIRFRLDQDGAELASKAEIPAKSAIKFRSDFFFDQPYIVLMKRRDAKRPFFAMWVDNAELMSR